MKEVREIRNVLERVRENVYKYLPMKRLIFFSRLSLVPGYTVPGVAPRPHPPHVVITLNRNYRRYRINTRKLRRRGEVIDDDTKEYNTTQCCTLQHKWTNKKNTIKYNAIRLNDAQFMSIQYCKTWNFDVHRKFIKGIR